MEKTKLESNQAYPVKYYLEACPECLGTGQTKEGEQCQKCKGKGWVEEKL